MMKPDAIFYRDVYDIVSQIPMGRVLTYGAIARLRRPVAMPLGSGVRGL